MSFCQLSNHLPSLIPGSEILSQQPVQLASAGDGAGLEGWEIVYTITDEADGSRIKMLNVVVPPRLCLQQSLAMTLCIVKPRVPKISR